MIPLVVLACTFMINVCLAEIKCLVVRPGYGLQSEQCPTSAVGCRIRVRGDHIEWYELARLYDRNQLVCVYPEEYDTRSGCQKKPSGAVRCWCGSSDNCNDEYNSKDLYEAFNNGDTKRILEVQKRIDRGETISNEIHVETTTRFPRRRPYHMHIKKVPIEQRTTEAAPTTRHHHVNRIIVTAAPTTSRAASSTTTSSVTTTMSPTTTSPATTTSTTTSTTTTTTTTTTSTTSAPSTFHQEASQVVQEPQYLPNEIEEYEDYEDEVDETTTVVPFTLGSSFEETRRKLGKEMKEEDERLHELLRDEEIEAKMDEADEDNDALESSEINRKERRDRAHQEELKRQAEEERLARMEREEAESALGKEDNADVEDDEDYDQAMDGFGFTPIKSSSGYDVITSMTSLLGTLFVVKLL